MLKKLLDLARSRGEAVIVDSETGELFELRPLMEDFEDFVPDFSDFVEDEGEDPFADAPSIWSESEDAAEQTPEISFSESNNMAEMSQNFGVPASSNADLTDEDLIAKIDRDIEEWKRQQQLAQNATQSVEKSSPVADLNDLTLTPVQEPSAQAEVTPGEEQFYIEPVE